MARPTFEFINRDLVRDERVSWKAGRKLLGGRSKI